MSIPETLHELEILLDDCGLDEGWSDWLRALELQAIAVHDVKTRHELMDLLETILIEGELVDLIEFVPNHDEHGSNPQRRLEALIRALDENLISANQVAVSQANGR